ncbi:hypothetical protein ABT337_28090 [Saccharopolyspora hirsuta]|uniref:hypothetical protein n=1 Tax=Saccharopolyspora hirsuta TaxID=1837 RepID=UPI0033259FB8
MKKSSMPAPSSAVGQRFGLVQHDVRREVVGEQREVGPAGPARRQVLGLGGVHALQDRSGAALVGHATSLAVPRAGGWRFPDLAIRPAARASGSPEPKINR